MTREEKCDVFKQFFARSAALFNEFNEKCKSHSELRESYGFYIKPGQDDDEVNIFFGDRAYRATQAGAWKDKAYGPYLQYFQIDNGNVFVNLYPARTDNHRTTEEFITIDYIKKTKILLNKKYIAKHYKYLVSCLAVTSIENEPSIADNISFLYLRVTKKYVNRKIMHEPRINKYLKIAITLILTVGFSGFLVSFIPVFTNYNRNKKIETKIETIIENMNQITNTLNEINSGIDNYRYIIELEKTMDE
jgi:hypothetical protein